jgi:hypothetical protein
MYMEVKYEILWQILDKTYEILAGEAGGGKPKKESTTIDKG